MPPLVKVTLWKKFVKRSGKDPRSNLKQKIGYFFFYDKEKVSFHSPCEDFCEDRVPHVVAHHVSFLYAKLGPQGKGLDL